MIYRIFKYQLPQGPDRKHQIKLPSGSFALHIGVQLAQPIVWMAVNQDMQTELIYEFTCIATGGLWDKACDDYIATVQMPDGLVWHYVAQIIYPDANNP